MLLLQPILLLSSLKFQGLEAEHECEPHSSTMIVHPRGISNYLIELVPEMKREGKELELEQRRKEGGWGSRVIQGETLKGNPPKCLSARSHSNCSRISLGVRGYTDKLGGFQ